MSYIEVTAKYAAIAPTTKVKTPPIIKIFFTGSTY